MRLLHRHDDNETVRSKGDAAYDERGDGRPYVPDRDDLGRRSGARRRSTSGRRWDLGSALAVAAGIALIVFGVLALVRTGVNSTWYEPVEQVLGMDHTPLLGAVEIGAGVLLVLAGLAGARMFAALVAAAIGVAATIVAIEPDVANPEFAIERSWAIAPAVGGFVLAFILVASRASARPPGRAPLGPDRLSHDSQPSTEVGGADGGRDRRSHRPRSGDRKYVTGPSAAAAERGVRRQEQQDEVAQSWLGLGALTDAQFKGGLAGASSAASSAPCCSCRSASSSGAAWASVGGCLSPRSAALAGGTAPSLYLGGASRSLRARRGTSTTARRSAPPLGTRADRGGR